MFRSSSEPRRTAIGVRDVLDAIWLGAFLSPSLNLVTELASSAVPPDATSNPVEATQTGTSEFGAQHISAASAAAASTKLAPEAGTLGGLFAPGSNPTAREQSIPARPIRIPAGSALPNGLPIIRAIRSLPTRLPSLIDVELDEAATADASAHGLGIFPVLRPRLERWFDATLVVEHSASAEMWAQTVIEIERMLICSGVFRDVRTFRLQLAPTLQLLNGSGGVLHPGVLRDPTARRIIFVFSPGVSSAWIDGTLGVLLESWGTATPVTLLHALPRRLWTNTVLGEPAALVASARLGGPNTSLHRRRAWWARARRLAGRRVTLPVLALEPESAQRWADMFAGRRGRTAPAFLVPTERSTNTATIRRTRAEPGVRERVELFRANAPEAFRLAVRLAIGPFTMPVLYLVQSSLFGKEAQHSQVAEVMLSGLVTRLTAIDTQVSAEHVQFTFVPEASALLLESLRRDDARALSALLQTYIQQHFGMPKDQLALLADEHGSRLVPSAARPFAQLNGKFLQWLALSLPHGRPGMKPTIARAVEASAQGRRIGPQPAADVIPIDLARRVSTLQKTFAELPRTDIPWLAGLNILWIEDYAGGYPSNDDVEWRAIRELGASLERVNSLAQGKSSVTTHSYDIVVVDTERLEGYRVDMDFLVRANRSVPVLIYGPRWSGSDRKKANTRKVFGSANDRHEIIALLIEAASAVRAYRFNAHYPGAVQSYVQSNLESNVTPLPYTELLSELPDGVARRIADMESNHVRAMNVFVRVIGAITQSRYVQLFRMENSELSLVAEHRTGRAYRAVELGGLIGRAARTGRTVWASDVSREKDYIATEKSTRSELAIPAFDENGRVIFVVNIERTVVNALSGSQIRWLESFVQSYRFPHTQPTEDLAIDSSAASIPARPYWFYVSCVKREGAPWLDTFLTDLGREVQLKAGIREPVRFVDNSDIVADESWSERVAQALAGSKMLLAIVSPAYVQSHRCGMEWQFFADREELTVAGSILPVVWMPVSSLPVAVAAVGFNQADFPASYTSKGLRYLTRRRSSGRRSELNYKKVVEGLAAAIVDYGTRLEAPTASRPPNDKELRNAFEGPTVAAQSVVSEGDLGTSEHQPEHVLAEDAMNTVTILIATTRRRTCCVERGRSIRFGAGDASDAARRSQHPLVACLG